MKKTILWITQTAVMLALLITLQAVTRPAGQFVTGSCVNLILALSVLVVGLWSGLTIALLSPLFAYLLGIGPALPPLLPAMAAGSAVYVLLLAALCRKGLAKQTAKAYVLSLGGMVLAAGAKFLTLWLLITQLITLCFHVPPPIVAAFSWPQLVTASIGGSLAILIAPLLRRALHAEPAK